MALPQSAGAIGLALVILSSTTLAAPPPPDNQTDKQEAQRLATLPPVVERRAGQDHSGRKQKGGASYYAHRFANRKTANGNRFNPNADTAASKTLPLGTTAKVTNAQNGKSATVKVDDRGPYIDGRIVDVTPKVADQLDMRKDGVAPVVVAPIAVPQPDGAMKLGAGAVEVGPEDLAKATEATSATRRPRNRAGP